MVEGSPLPARRFAILLVVGSAIGALVWWWWCADVRSDIKFLPHHSPAEWIVYPYPPDAMGHRNLELAAVFKRSFFLNSVPKQGELKVAGFHRCSVWLNGRVLEQRGSPGGNWKQPQQFEVSTYLNAGTNELRVTVFNSNGPPALWLCLRTGAFTLVTGEDWEVSCAGAVWRNAVLATKPKSTLRGTPLAGGEEAWTSLKKCWFSLAVFAALSAAGYWLLDKLFSRWRAMSEVGSWRKEILLPAGLAAAWLVLSLNNLSGLPPLIGYDVDGHLGYIRYLQEHHRLPTANEGWEMFQPPLYYMLCSVLLEVLSLPAAGADAVAVLRVLGLAIGIANFFLVWATLRLLFPKDLAKARWGLLLAASLPPMIYLSQYVTNEALAAAWVSVSVYLTVRLVKQERPSFKLQIGLGLCLGAALLTKATSVLAVPLIVGALLWRWLEKRDTQPLRCAGNLAAILTVCLLVCGWHYARTWMLFGSPFIGVWNPKTGFAWWQDDGYHTSAFYLRFGDVLLRPWMASMRSFAGGIYSTLWGDGLLGGVSNLSFRTAWNYNLMAIGFWLALFPTLLILIGSVRAVRQFIRQPSAEWFLMLGLAFLVGGAVVQLSLAVPFYCAVKAFYGLSALVPLCALAALGLDSLAREHRRLRAIGCVLFGLWAINSFSSFWIRDGSTPVAVVRAQSQLEEGRYFEAVEVLKTQLQVDPQSKDARSLLVTGLIALGDLEEASKQAAILVQQHPSDPIGYLDRSTLSAKAQRLAEASEDAQRATELAPGLGQAWQQFATLLVQQGRYSDALEAARQGLSIIPFSPELRFDLGTALVAQNQTEEAIAQFELALALKPEWAGALNDLAWIRATHPQARFRNGEQAIRLAEQACRLTRFKEAVFIGTLAAAYAEASRFEDAVLAAEKARELALASDEKELAEKNRKLIELFNGRQAFRDLDLSTNRPLP